VAREPLGEDDAVRLFVARAADARGAPVTAGDLPDVKRIVALLGGSRAAILLAAARASELSPRALADALEMMDAADAPTPDVRARLSRGEAHRLLGRLPEASADLLAVLRDASGDLHAQAEAHRLLGAVYRAQGRADEALAHKEEAVAKFTALGDPVMRAVAHGELGTALGALGRLREARVCHEQALAAHRELGHRKNEGTELSYLGVTLHRLGLLEEARRAHEGALAIHRETGHTRLLGADHLHLGYVAHELGELDVGRAHLEQAAAILREVGDRALVGVTLSHAGALEIEAGRPELAGPLLHQALALHAQAESPRHEATTWMHLAWHHAALGEHDEAASALERAAALGHDRAAAEDLAWILALQGRFDDARALRVEDVGTRRALRLLEDAARVRSGSPRPAVDAALAEQGLHAGTSTRLRRAEAALDAALRATGAVLEIAPDGRWFRAADGTRADLSRRRPLRLALLVLVGRRLAAPGTGLSWQELLAAGWPGERVQAEAGFSRVRNALSQLRKLGLKDALLTRDDGYLLDPDVPVRHAEV
jgi:tetratricopeptide (TPR) repeat protein